MQRRRSSHNGVSSRLSQRQRSTRTRQGPLLGPWAQGCGAGRSCCYKHWYPEKEPPGDVVESAVHSKRRGLMDSARGSERERERERDGDVDEQCQADDRLRTYLGQEDREVSLCFCLQGDHLPERMARMARSCHACSEYTCYACCIAEAVLCDHKASALWPGIAHWHSPKNSHLCLRGRVFTRSSFQGSSLERERSSKSSCPNLLSASHVNFRGADTAAAAAAAAATAPPPPPSAPRPPPATTPPLI